jgi:AraC-like DNA-binding protein
MNREAWQVLAAVDFSHARMFDTDDVDHAVAVSGRFFGRHQLRVLGRAACPRVRMDHRALGPLSLSRLSWGAAVAIDTELPVHDYLITLPLRGRAVATQAGRQGEASPAVPAIAGGGQRLRIQACADFDQLLLRIDRAAVTDAWTALTGEPPAQPPVFDDTMPTTGPAWPALVPVLGMLAQAANAAAPLPHLYTRLQDLLVTTLLLQQPHNLGAPLTARPPASDPTHLRRAEAYLRAHLSAAVTLAQLSQACGVPGRTLQWAFQRAHGCGPLQWLRAQRLAAVRQAVLAGSGGVSECALRHGFSHLGEFSRAYRLRFGETASQTLTRSTAN